VYKPSIRRHNTMSPYMSLLVCSLVLSSVEAFSSPKVLHPPKTARTLLRSLVDNPKVEQSAFDSIEDEGDDINLEVNSVADVVPSQDGIDKLLNKALTESVQSVQDNFPPELLGDGTLNIMEDETLKKEIAQIFDKASLDLKAALEDIRIEQEEFARQSAQKSIAKTEAAMRSDQARMNQAEDSMVKMIGKVNRETAEVERAVEELRKAQDSMASDPIMQMLSGGLVKQSALAGTILFTLRSGADTVAMFGGDATHAAPALIQGGLALACAAYFVFA
jgi:hypothetical protein